MEKPIYDQDQFLTDMEFVLKKLGLTELEFKNIMNLPIKQHEEFETIVKSYFEKYPFFKPF